MKYQILVHCIYSRINKWVNPIIVVYRSEHSLKHMLTFDKLFETLVVPQRLRLRLRGRHFCDGNTALSEEEKRRKKRRKIAASGTSCLGSGWASLSCCCRAVSLSNLFCSSSLRILILLASTWAERLFYTFCWHFIHFADILIVLILEFLSVLPITLTSLLYEK